MRHISPTEMVYMRETIPVSRVIFRKPDSGSGVIVEMLAKNGEEIMISEQGTPDPVVFTSPAVMEFFRKLDFLSGMHDEVILDAGQYRPAGFGFMQGKPETSFGDLRQRGESADVLDYADESSEEPQTSPFTTTIYTLGDSPPEEFSLDEIAEKGLESEENTAPEPKIGEKYLTTKNLLILTGIMVVIELVLLFMLPPAVQAMQEALYICAGAMVVLAASYLFFEKSNPNHPSLRMRRYVWLCVVVFNFSLSVSYVIGGRLAG
jgi:hypothetical protein